MTTFEGQSLIHFYNYNNYNNYNNNNNNKHAILLSMPLFRNGVDWKIKSKF